MDWSSIGMGKVEKEVHRIHPSWSQFLRHLSISTLETSMIDFGGLSTELICPCEETATEWGIVDGSPLSLQDHESMAFTKGSCPGSRLDYMWVSCKAPRLLSNYTCIFF